MNAENLSYKISSDATRLKASLDYAFVAAQANIEQSAVDEDWLWSWYLSQSVLGRCDPNRQFSEQRYLRKYPDVLRAVSQGIFVSGFDHWLLHGQSEGRTSCRCWDDPALFSLRNAIDFSFLRKSHPKDFPFIQDDRETFDIYVLASKQRSFLPSAKFNEPLYRESNRDVGEAIEAGRYVSGFHHWIVTGKGEGRKAKLPAFEGVKRAIAQQRVVESTQRSRWKQFFDEDYYRSFLRERCNVDAGPRRSFELFMQEGIYRGDVPTLDFDEDFYLAYYEDVAQAHGEGIVPSGFVHYVVVGQEEGRIRKHDLVRCLEVKMGALTDPIFLRSYESIELKIKSPEVDVDPNSIPRMNIFVPSLDPDIMFGGYISLLNFLCRVSESGILLRFFICEDGQSNKAWFLRGIGKRKRWIAAFRDAEFHNISDGKKALKVGNEDICLAYSAWTAYKASAVSLLLRRKSFIFFIQEYEPIFHENNSLQFFVEGSYSLQHAALFNTDILADYFAANGLGVFSKRGSGNSLSYQHALGGKAADIHSMRSKARKTLLFYARPEMHAGRNLFEVGVIALKAAAERGIINKSWRVVGLGALGTEALIPLPNSVTLELYSRLPLEEYELMLSSVDVGLSLMWAPHPSILPFELARSGAVCVTNVYSNRSEEVLANFGFNIVPAEPTIEGLVAALETAVERSADLEARVEASKFSWPSNWDDVFTEGFIKQAISLVSGSS